MQSSMSKDIAVKRLHENKSPRYCRLEWLESWVDGTQYDSLPSWWTDDVPQWERRPCVIYKIVELAISSNVDLMLGERAFPRFTVESEGDEDKFITELHKLSRFRTVCRDAFAAAQGCGTACAIYGVRNGAPFGELLPAKWCEPEFSDANNFTVSKLVIQYPYMDQQRQSDGSWASIAMVYRRVVDGENDTVYKPAVAPEGGREIKWVEDSVINHSFGFCPVVWYPFMRGTAAVNVIDGKAIHENDTDEIQAHDIARSQWHKTALYCDPQPYEIGVAEGYNPTGSTGRTANIPTTEHGGQPHPNDPTRGAFICDRSTPARKKGPGHVWSYTDHEVKVGYLTVPGDALTSQRDNVSDLRTKLQEALAVVFLDPENIKFAATTSGKALEAIKQKQFDRVDQYREDFRDGFLLPSLMMQLRVLSLTPATSMISTALPSAEMIQGTMVSWGSYTAPDFEEQRAIIDLVSKAYLDGLIDLKTAISKLVDSDVFEIEDIDAFVEALQKKELDDNEMERELVAIARGAREKQGPRENSGGGSAATIATKAPGESSSQ